MIRATNFRLEVIRKEQRKKEEIMQRQKTKTMATRYQRARREINLFDDKKGNDKSDI